MKPFTWLQERLAHDTLDHTVTLTFSQRGSWMGLRMLECFQLTGTGSFSWEWEDAYAHISYQRHTSVLDPPTTAALFHLFQAGISSLLPFQDGQPLPALLPDALAASFSIRVADQLAHYFYPLDTRHRSTIRSTGGESPARTVAPQLQQLLDQFVRLRKAALDERPLP